MKAKPYMGLAFVVTGMIIHTNHKKMKRLITLLFVGLIFSNVYSLAQSVDFQYISPVPGSKYIMPGNNIAFRHGNTLDLESVKNELIEVSTRKGELQRGELVLSDDSKTLIFLPEIPFPLDTRIDVKFSSGLKTKTGQSINPVDFSFYTTKQLIETNKNTMHGFSDFSELPGKQFNHIHGSKLVKDNSYPEGYPNNEVLINNNPPAGKYFLAINDTWGQFSDTEPFVVIVDHYGTPVFYRKFENYSYDLKVQPTGHVSCYSYDPYWGNIVMDSSYNILEVYQMGNGYNYTDFHDFQMLENGHVIVMTYDSQLIDMSQIIAGGNTSATVYGFVFQELDSDHNVVFQWRSWDHFEIIETGPEVDLLGETVDLVHGNTVEVESDTSFLISSRNYHEITKIHRNTGEIIWRFGGSQNQFEFVNDTLGWSRQHDSRRIENGHVTLYDNGTYHPEPQFSSALEYDVNPDEMTATLVNRYRHNPDYFGGAMGNAFWTPDETIVVGWGTFLPGITEFDIEGNPLWELYFEGMSYRAYRFPWKTNRFNLEMDSLHFGYIWMNDSLTKTIEVINPQSKDLILTSFHHHHSNFMLLDEFPVVVPANSSLNLSIRFLPDSAGYFEDIITLNADFNSDTLVQRIAQQVTLLGYATQGQSINELENLKFVIFPNPAKDQFFLRTEADEPLQFEVLDIMGKRFYIGETIPGKAYEVSTENWKSGIYVVRINPGQPNEAKARLIIR